MYYILYIDLLDIKILYAESFPPQGQEYNIKLPKELENYESEIEHIYYSKYRGRKLQWCYHMSHGIVSWVDCNE